MDVIDVNKLLTSKKNNFALFMLDNCFVNSIDFLLQILIYIVDQVA